jgi:hypothetical protein
MRNLRYAAVGLVGLVGFSLAGCATPSTGGTGTTTPDLSAIETQIRDTATKICLFVPTLNTVAQVVTALTGGQAVAVNVGDVAQKICDAVAAAPAASRRGASAAPTLVVNGVPIEIHGRFKVGRRR